MENELHELVAKADTTEEEIIQFFKKNPNALNVEHTKNGTRAVEEAAESGNFYSLKYLIEDKKADIDASAREFNLLSCARENPDPQVLNYLADPENQLIAKFNDGTNALHVAVFIGDIEKIKLVLEKSPELVLAVNKRGETALFLAASFGKQTVVHAITTHKAFITLQNEDKYDSMFMGSAHRMRDLSVINYNVLKEEVLKEIDSPITLIKETIQCYLSVKNIDYLNLGGSYFFLANCYYDKYSELNAGASKDFFRKESINACNTAISSLSKTEDKEEKFLYQSLSHTALGDICFETKEFDKAIEHYNQSIEHYKKLKNGTPDKLNELESALRNCMVNKELCIDKKSLSENRYFKSLFPEMVVSTTNISNSSNAADIKPT